MRQAGELLGQLAGSVQLGLDQVKSLQALERPEVLRRLAQLVAEVVGPAVYLTHFRSRRALGDDEQFPQAELQCEFVFGPLGTVRQRCEERQSFGDGGDGVLIGMARAALSPACCQ